MKHFYFFLVAFVLVTVFPSANVQAADPMGRFGWMAIVSDIIGDDVTCGAGFVKQELVIRSVDTGNLATPNFAIFRSEDTSSGSLYDLASGSGSTIGPICFNPDTQSLEIAIDGGASFYDFMALSEWQTPAIVPRGKFMRTTVWLASTSTGTAEYQHLSPVNAITNVDPQYKIALNDFPTTYGATGLSEANLFVRQYDPMTNTIGNTVVVKTLPLSGGTAIKTLPAQSIADGIYTWAYYLKLNGSHNAGGLNVTQILVSGFSFFDWPFMLDSTPPNFGTGVSHAPANPYDTDPVTITANVADSLSGIKQITLYLDGNPVPVKTCSFFSSSSASCIFVGGPYLAGSNHTYFAKATDVAGNVATSATMNFTVLSAAPTLTLSASPASIISGDSSTLTWTVGGTADACWASNGWSGGKAFSGTNNFVVTPAVTTTYTLECWNAGISSGQKSATVTVIAATTVNGICSATPETCVAGTYSDSPANNATNMQWTCLGTGTPVGANSPTCTSPQPIPVTTFTGIPANLPFGGGNVTFAWSITNPAGGGSCTAYGTGFAGVKATSGPEVVNVPTATTFDLDCWNGNGTAAARVSVPITIDAPTTVNGMCNSTPELCTRGTYFDSPADTPTHYQWTCLGAGVPVGADSPTCIAPRCNPKTCADYPALTQAYCSTSPQRTFPDNCGGTTDPCSGTRYCDFNWREVSP